MHFLHNLSITFSGERQIVEGGRDPLGEVRAAKRPHGQVVQGRTRLDSG
jgi:hypothetical protein